ncbi:MAG: hypothetical protein ACR2M4_12910, partial [Actinomycetota bacterium]
LAPPVAAFLDELARGGEVGAGDPHGYSASRKKRRARWRWMSAMKSVMGPRSAISQASSRSLCALSGQLLDFAIIRREARLVLGKAAFRLDLVLHRIAERAELVRDAAQEDCGTGFHGEPGLRGWIAPYCNFVFQPRLFSKSTDRAGRPVLICQ